jgi:hypothetical protein
MIVTYKWLVLQTLLMTCFSFLSVHEVLASEDADSTVVSSLSTMKKIAESALLTVDSGSVQNLTSLKIQEKYKPNPQKAVWYSALCPGLGQLYNRRYWKLPFIGAGVCGIVYAIRWNTRYYNAYTNAYRDILDNDPNTDSYIDLLPRGTVVTNTSYLTTVLSNRQKKYRRSRDLSYVAAAGLYVISMLDAFVDAQLYDFDISPDLSLSPASSSRDFGGIRAVGLNLAYRF